GHEVVDPVGVVPDPALERAAPVAQLEPQVRLVLPGPSELAGLDVIAARHTSPFPQLVDGRPRERITAEPLADRGGPRSGGPALRSRAGPNLDASRWTAHRGPTSRSHTTRPPTMVSAACPTSFQPAKGVLRLLERNLSGSTIHSASRSMTVTSAGEPTARVPPGSRNARAGPQLMRSTSWLRVSTPFRTSSVRAIPRAVSRPTIPNGASSNACSFSS